MYDEFNDKEQNNVTGGTPSNSGEGYRQDEVYEQSDAQPSNENMVYDADETADTIESPETSETADTAEEQAYAQPDNQMTSSQNQNGQAQNNSFYHYAYDRDNRQEEEQQQDQQGQQQHSYGSYQTGGQNPNPPRYEKPKKKKSMMSKIAVAASVAVVFGVVASASFQITDYVGGKVFPQTKQTEAKISSTGTVNELNKTAEGSTVSTSSTDVAKVAENAMPSIVAITSKTVKEVQTYFYGTQAQEEESSGSGIIIGKNDKELLIATNNHVVEGSENLTVCFTVNVENQEDKVVQAQVKGTDPEHDLAMVAVQLSDIPADVLNQVKIAEIGDSDNLQVGQQAIAIGNALGYGQSVTSGIISALNREVSVETTSGTVTNSLIQTDAAINFGNSGGALLNINGQLIGINSVKAASSGVEGMGYAIPINTAKPILDDLMNRTTRSKVESSEKGYMGVKPVDVSEEAKQVYNMPSGAFLYEVVEGSAAEKAGLIKGDIVTKIDGISITSANDLYDRMNYYKAGETIDLEVQAADGGEYKARTVSITLDKQSADTTSNNTNPQSEDSSNGQSQQDQMTPMIPNQGGNGMEQFFNFNN
ncbi:S1C family serine protease [Robinsoniella peoriensis]|uniref:S1C family serine protease n=1 Tax=Robinsoniella peoriensis TaxID=180332 RepID=UPI000694376B|nr:trypsin-like peptidase domain-containing protein [Robinsoniella peoriensis]